MTETTDITKELEVVMTWQIILNLPDGSIWSVPVKPVAENRAERYAQEYDGDKRQSLIDDTLPLFLDDPYEITDWASNNMDWDDVKQFAVEVTPAKDLTPEDWQEAWLRVAENDIKTD